MNYDFGDAPDLFDLVKPMNSVQNILRHAWSSPEKQADYVRGLRYPGTNWLGAAWAADGNMGSDGMTTALRLATQGWPEGAARAQRLLDLIKTKNPEGRRVVKWDVAGGVPSVARALAGNPLNMRRADVTRLHRRPVVTLVSNMSVHWGVRPDVIERRAVVVTAIVDKIEEAGFSCEVVGYAGSSSNNVGWSILTRLKESSQSVDLGRLAFGLGHTSMFRRLGFACATMHTVTKPQGYSLGYPHTSLKVDNDQSVYVVPSLSEPDFSSDDAASTRGLRAMTDSLVAQGCQALMPEEH